MRALVNKNKIIVKAMQEKKNKPMYELPCIFTDKFQSIYYFIPNCHIETALNFRPDHSIFPLTFNMNIQFMSEVTPVLGKLYLVNQ